MLIVWLVIGIIGGWLADALAARLPRWTGHVRPAEASDPLAPPAVLRWVRRDAASPASRLALAVELGSGVFLAALWASSGASQTFWVLSASYFFLLLIALIDLRHRLVLNLMVYPALAVALAAHLLAADQPLAQVLVGGGMAFAIFFLAGWLRPGQLGFGDVKLATLIGVGVGFPAILWALLIGTGAAGAVALWLLSRGASAGTRLPYAPFLCLGALVALLSAPFALPG